MKAFITISHTTKLLKFQLDLIKQNLPEVNDVTLVVGPFGSNPMTCAGNQIFTPRDAMDLGVKLVPAPQTLAGLMPGLRYKTLMSWLLEFVVAEESGPCLILQGDCLPIHPMSVATLMGGAEVASRQIIRRENPYMYPTWMLIRGNPVLENIDLSQVRDLEIKNNKWSGVPYKGWDSYAITEETAEEFLGGHSGYKTSMHFEWCEPGFLHVDKIASSYARNSMINDKLQVLKCAFNQEFEEVIGPTHGLKAHPARVIDRRKEELRHNKAKKPGMNKVRSADVPKRGPSLVKMIGNFSKAVVRHVADGNKKVSEEFYRARLEVCNGCEFKRKDRCLHADCGCFLAKKAWWASENCPKGKWPTSVEVSQEDAAVVESGL